jgi:hypothetical protein
VWAPAVHRSGHIAVMASDDQTVVSVTRLTQPGVELTSAKDPDLAPMVRAVIVHVVQAQKLETSFTTARAGGIATAVVQQCCHAVSAKSRSAVLVITRPAPRERSLSVGSQCELRCGLRFPTARTVLGADANRALEVLELTSVVLAERRAFEAVDAIGQHTHLAVDGKPIRKMSAAPVTDWHRTYVL